MAPIVYLHGFASSPASSKARHFEERLRAGGACVTVPDLADGDFAHLTISGQLAILERAAGAGPVHLVGSSMGGYLAALFAARHANVGRLVLLAPAFRFHQRWLERLGATEMERWRREDALEVFHYGEGRNRTLRYRLMEDAEQYEAFPDFLQPADLSRKARRYRAGRVLRAICGREAERRSADRRFRPRSFKRPSVHRPGGCRIPNLMKTKGG